MAFTWVAAGRRVELIGPVHISLTNSANCASGALKPCPQHSVERSLRVNQRRKSAITAALEVWCHSNDMSRKTLLIVSLLGVSAVSSLLDGLFFQFAMASRPAIAVLADTLLAFLLVLWVVADSKDHPQVVRPFDYGYLVLMIWPLYLPYYLLRTRGAAGLLSLAGFVGVLFMGFIIRLVIYSCVT